MPYAQNASSGFALRTYRFDRFMKILAQRGGDEPPERLLAKQGGGGIAIMIFTADPA
jgi:hypothetical protein